MRKFFRGILFVLILFIDLIFLTVVYFVVVSIVYPPVPANTSSLGWLRTEVSPGFFTLKNSWFRKSESGLYELYVAGDGFERGVVNGKLTMELVQRQEDHFAAQIEKIIPSKFYRNFLRYFIAAFNRNLDKNVPEEYQEEIYGISTSASAEYNYIGSPYQRMMNYHAAHDIGHALQSMALVGCTSFGTWNSRSADSTLIIGRNFDFYVGDQFSEEKIVAFFNPSEGYNFMTVTWGGFIGAVSGMNEYGLTVTINAAKTNMPSGSATPVSLVAREILQYSKTINEAIALAKKRKMFVAESFLVGSAIDNKAVLIEKTPDALDVYDPGEDQIICANHFQSPLLINTPENIDQIENSASSYRFKRLSELLDSTSENTVDRTVEILRDQQGLGGTDIGMGNEKSINQLIVHHSVVFQPAEKLVWVSTSPWQLGEFIAYDLDEVFALDGMKNDREISIDSLTIRADPFLETEAFSRFKKFRELKSAILDGKSVDIQELINSNPGYYHTYVLAGNAEFENKNYHLAKTYYEEALTHEIATRVERDYVLAKISECDKMISVK